MARYELDPPQKHKKITTFFSVRPKIHLFHEQKSAKSAKIAKVLISPLLKIELKCRKSGEKWANSTIAMGLEFAYFSPDLRHLGPIFAGGGSSLIFGFCCFCSFLYGKRASEGPRLCKMC